MSDERLREAERRWKESGSVEDEARYLLERVRVGDLTQERLELAAYCGHAGATKAVGDAIQRPNDSHEWTVGLNAELAFVIRIAAYLAEWAIPRMDRQQADAQARLIGALHIWLACPCEHHGRLCRDATPLGLGSFTQAVRSLSEIAFWCADTSAYPGLTRATLLNHLWELILSSATTMAATPDEALRTVLSRVTEPLLGRAVPD